ncbi:serine hydrolase domain-containing protein [Dyadobacter luticola]|nr:serine hydrolase domain-containing protein [Dyadobacter luticola]
MHYFRTFLCFIFAIISLILQPVNAQNSRKSQEIDQYLREIQAKSNIPGFAIAVVTKDSVIFSKGYGADSKGIPINSRSPFAIASLSKAFTAMAVMQLAEQGKMNIDNSINQYIPTFKLADPRGAKMTVRQVLNQVSGLNDKVFPELAFKTEPENLDKAIERLNDVKLADDPGTRFTYHNPNYQILAKVVEQVSGQPFDKYLEANIFKPLQMSGTKSVSSTSALSSSSSGFSDGHIFAFGKAIPLHEPDWFIEGAAGVVSTADDMAKWLRLQLNQGKLGDVTLLDSTTLKMMHNAPTGKPYGMGWFVGKDGTLSHSGILWTYSAEQIITKNGYGVVILFNGGINAFEDYHAFIQGVTDILENKKPEVPTFPAWVFPITLNVALLIGIFFVILRLFRIEQWYRNHQKRPRWKSRLLLFSRLVPMLILVLLPVLVTMLSGRVLSWRRIYLMAPDFLTLFSIVALLNLVLVFSRLLSFNARPLKPN